MHPEWLNQAGQDANCKGNESATVFEFGCLPSIVCLDVCLCVWKSLALCLNVWAVIVVCLSCCLYQCATVCLHYKTVNHSFTVSQFHSFSHPSRQQWCSSQCLWHMLANSTPWWVTLRLSKQLTSRHAMGTHGVESPRFPD